MRLAPGVRLGPYEVVGALGAGGMGEVYRARDTRLDRTVAIKVLAPQVATDPLFRERFEREAKAISALDHPHICALYDVGNAVLSAVTGPAGSETPVHFLVMQYLEGETLADRLARTTPGPLPLDQTLRHAAEVAAALDAAHRRGIVHRDLKPGNVMITKSGVKLLDFGLAKTTGPAGVHLQTDLTASPTVTAPLTSEGSLLGTLQYMSPEQLHAGDVDARSDIFAFGAILFEMLTGRRAFEGASQAGTIAAILDAHPPPLDDLADRKSAMPPSAHRALDRLLRKCLAKNPDERWQSAADLADELKWIDQERLRAAGESDSVAGTKTTGADTRTRQRWLMPIATAAIVAFVTLAGWMLSQSAPPAAEPIRFTVLPPDGQRFAPGGAPVGALAVSPDGRQIAFVAGPSADSSMAWIRSLDTLIARPLPGTEGAAQLFWSPDARYLGFAVAEAGGLGKLRRIAVTGGPVQEVADIGPGRAAWSSQGIIIFRAPDRRLHRVSDTGGQTTPVTELDEARQETGHSSPVFLPDGRRFIFLGQSRNRANSALFLGSLDSAQRTHLVDVFSSVEIGSGHLLFQRDGTLMAQPFDEKQGRMTGDAVPLVEPVLYNANNGRAAVTVSQTGVLIYRTGASGLWRLTWLDAGGRATGTVGAEGIYFDASLSPDGRWIAVTRADQMQSPGDVWLINVEGGIPTRLTKDAADDSAPVWSPDGKDIVFRSNRKGTFDLYRRASGGAGTEELLFESPEEKIPTSFSADGKLLLFSRRMTLDKRTDIWALPMTGDRRPFEVLSTAYSEGFAVFSPDGRWMAYDSDDEGGQVYVQPFPPSGTRVRLSTTGGLSPKWLGGGKQIVYVTQDRRFMAVDLTVSGGELHPSVPRELFTHSTRRVTPRLVRDFAVDASGRRFLVQVPRDEGDESPLNVVLNWTADLRLKR